MTNVLSVAKEGLPSYFDKVYSRSSINEMWILKKTSMGAFNSHTFSKFHLSKHLIFPRFALPFLMKN